MKRGSKEARKEGRKGGKGGSEASSRQHQASMCTAKHMPHGSYDSL